MEGISGISTFFFLAIRFPHFDPSKTGPLNKTNTKFTQEKKCGKITISNLGNF